MKLICHKDCISMVIQGLKFSFTPNYSQAIWRWIFASQQIQVLAQACRFFICTVWQRSAIMTVPNFICLILITSDPGGACCPRLLKCSFTFVLIFYTLQLFRDHRQVFLVSVCYLLTWRIGADSWSCWFNSSQELVLLCNIYSLKFWTFEHSIFLGVTVALQKYRVQGLFEIEVSETGLGIAQLINSDIPWPR